ncbi:MAG: SDR family NAD(P)-dependent oxidoreductase [Ignavibacteria bacterium]|nr:SDR family NAD(P)-dependent oxidoreductase [Ignavibacteria bacterium]
MQDKEKVIIITGGTGALGRVVVSYLSKVREYKLYLPVLDVKKASNIFHNQNDDVNSELRKIYIMECNGFNHHQVKKFISDVATLENGKIDALINIIGGIHKLCNVVDMSPEFFEENFRLNFLTTYYFSHFVLKYMAAQKYGIIVSIGAMAGLREEAGRFAYSLSKYSLIHLMNTISKEMKDFNIRCNTIVPYIIDTEANRQWAKGDEYKDWVSPLEIATLISDLIQDKYPKLKESVIKLY